MGLDAYLKIGSGVEQVLGECRDPHHVGWVKILAFGVSSQPQGNLGGTERRHVNKCHIEKSIDRTSAPLVEADRSARTFDSFTIDLADSRTGLPKYRQEFQDVSITEFYVSRNKTNDLSTESFVFEFESLKINQNPVPDDAVQQMLMLFARMLVR